MRRILHRHGIGRPDAEPSCRSEIQIGRRLGLIGVINAQHHAKEAAQATLSKVLLHPTAGSVGGDTQPDSGFGGSLQVFGDPRPQWLGINQLAQPAVAKCPHDGDIDGPSGLMLQLCIRVKGAGSGADAVSPTLAW